jgi:hypothetical protein
MLIALTKDIGAFIENVICGAVSFTAAGTGDNTAVTGQSIDRIDYGSAKFTIAYKTTLAESKHLQLAAEYQESSDDSNWDTAVSLQTIGNVVTGGTGGSTEYGELSFDLDLTGKKRYIRFNFTPNLDATGTDTAITAAIASLGGKRVIS